MLAFALAAAAAPTAPATVPQASPPGVVGAVVVTARRPVTGDLQTGVVDYRPAFFTPIRPASALDMVNWLPGFVFEDTRDMRGLEGSGGNVLIDGKPPTSKTDTLQSVLKRIPADEVERVDLIVGGAPGIDMHGRNVIANVVLKPRTKPLQVVTAATYLDTHARAAPSLLLTHSSKNRGRALEASLELVRNIAIFPGYGYGPWVRRDGSGAVQFAADERFEYDGPYGAASGSYEFPLAGGRFRVSGLGKLTHETQDEHDRLTSGPGAYGFRHDDDYWQAELGLRYERAFGRLNLEVQTLDRYRRQSTVETFRRPPQPFDDRVESHALETVQRAVLRYRQDDALTLEGSAEHTLNDSANHTRASQDGRPVAIPVADIDLTEHRWDGGLTAAWKPGGGGFSLDAALKAETSRLRATGDMQVDRRLTYPKPRLALAWSPDKQSQLRLRAEYEVQQVPLGAIITFNEYQSGQFRNGNADLRPPRAAVGEAVFERHFWSTGDLTVTARYQALEDVLDVVPVLASGAGYQMLANIGGGRETDLIGNLMVPLKRLGLGGSTLRAVVTWRRARVTDPVSGLARNRSNFPELQEELHFAQDLPRWKLNWGIDAFYRGGTTLYRPFGDEAMDAWPHVNVFVERRLPRRMSLRIEVQNLPGAAPKGTVSVFAGLRDRSPLLYVDERRLSVGPLVYLRLRKTLGEEPSR